jgi:hypothetical protein
MFFRSGHKLTNSVEDNFKLGIVFLSQIVKSTRKIFVLQQYLSQFVISS